MELYVASEYDPLKAVLVHRPGPEIDRLNYHNMRRFLFEDIPYLKRMQDEHDEFVGRMREHDIEVVYAESLLKELMSGNDEARRDIIEEVCEAEQCPHAIETLLSGALGSDDLLDILFAGLTHREFKNIRGQDIDTNDGIEDFLLTPIPNAYFSRDPAVVAKNTLISCKMHYRERVRETILARAILEWHPSFENTEIVYGGSDRPDEDRPLTVEGGDVTVISADALMIGVSERTSWEAVERIASNVFHNGHMKRVYAVMIPQHRDYMHLDTIFTVVDRGTIVWFSQVMENLSEIRRYDLLDHDDKIMSDPAVETRSIQSILEEEFDCHLTTIDTAGGDPHYAPREQRTDGTNVLAIAPRKVLMYERNFKTKEELDRCGIETISIPGSELVRGLGGPRCMSMPLRRARR